jgi:hypothetical protein
VRRLLRLAIAGLLVVGGLWLAGPAAAQPPAGPQPAPPTTTILTPPAAHIPPDLAAAAPPPRPPVGPGLFDLAGRIREAINGWFRDLPVCGAASGYRTAGARGSYRRDQGRRV